MGLGTLWLAREIYKAENPKNVDYDREDPLLDLIVLFIPLIHIVGGAILFVILLLAVF